MEKPRSIKLFDLVFAAGMLLAIGSLVINWQQSLGAIRSVTIALVVLFLGYGIGLLLWFNISRRRNNAARLILAGLTIIEIGLLLFGPADFAPSAGADPVYWIKHLLEIVQVILLFLPDSERWFHPYEDDVSIQNTFG